MVISSYRRKTSAPCNVCSFTIRPDQDIIYCSSCGEHYHKVCWQKNGNKCFVAACSGSSHKLWSKIEPRLLRFLKVNTSKLLTKCPNCQSDISPLHRYCSECGSDVNRPERQKTFRFYGLSLFILKVRKTIYLLTLAVTLILFSVISVSVVNATKIVKDNLSNYATRSAPTASLTHRPYTATTVFFTQTLRPTFTKSTKPTATKTLRPTFTYTPRPSLTPQPTRISLCTNLALSDSTNAKGTTIHVNLCGSQSYDVGPFPRGVYKLSPNKKFFVYVAADSDGSVYVSWIGSNYIKRIGRLKQDHNFSAFNQNENPSFKLTVTDQYVTIYEAIYNQTATYKIPDP